MEATLQTVLQSIGGAAAAQHLVGPNGNLLLAEHGFPGAFARSPSVTDGGAAVGGGGAGAFGANNGTDPDHISTPDSSHTGSVGAMAAPPYRMPRVLLGSERASPMAGVRFDLPASGAGETRNSTEWSGVRGGAVASQSPTDGDRLHSLPDNTLNPLGLLAEASLQNTRKRPVTVSEALEAAEGDVDEEGSERKKSKLGLSNTSYFQPGPMNSASPPSLSPATLCADGSCLVPARSPAPATDRDRAAHAPGAAGRRHPLHRRSD